MDYILFHSQYSQSSKKLFMEFPNLIEKSVSVDSAIMRIYLKKLHIVCVPTLLLTMDKKIIDRIIGYDKIYNWLLVTIYRTNQLQNSIDIEPQGEYLEETTVNVPVVQQIQKEVKVEQNDIPKQITKLDDLILTDEPKQEFLESRTEPKVQTGSSGSTLQIAEALKKERDNDLETNNKKRIPN